MLLRVTHSETCCLALGWHRRVSASGFWGLPGGIATMAGAGAGLGGCPASLSMGCTNTLSSKPQTASRAPKQQKERQSQTLFLQA